MAGEDSMDDPHEQTQVYKNSPGLGSNSEKNNLGVMKPQNVDYNYDYDNHNQRSNNDPMSMGGNSVIAQARREAE
jgi:hypothetical protein